jgi:hypothetical protein
MLFCSQLVALSCWRFFTPLFILWTWKTLFLFWWHLLAKFEVNQPVWQTARNEYFRGESSYNYTQVHKYLPPIPPSPPQKKRREKRDSYRYKIVFVLTIMQSEKRVYEELKRWYIRKWKITMITTMPSQNVI